MVELNETDCSSTCGNGMVELNETRDGDCPADCEDFDSCTLDERVGDPGTCGVQCVYSPVSECSSGDGCCPAGCSAALDNDCPSTCGNGTLDDGESCEGDCPLECPTQDACTVGLLTGNAAGCTARCDWVDIHECLVGDGCCPAGCVSAQDSDCERECYSDTDCSFEGMWCEAGRCIECTAADGPCCHDGRYYQTEDQQPCDVGCDPVALTCWPECDPAANCCEADGTRTACDHGCDAASGTCWPECDATSSICCLADGNIDPASEKQQPGSTTTWRRCSPGETWNQDESCHCSGLGDSLTWCDAAGVDTPYCATSHPGVDACELALGAPYRLPTLTELTSVLGGCVLHEHPNADEYQCTPCALSATCRATGLTDWTIGGAWSSTRVPGASQLAYSVDEDGEWVNAVRTDLLGAVVCVR